VNGKMHHRQIVIETVNPVTCEQAMFNYMAITSRCLRLHQARLAGRMMFSKCSFIGPFVLSSFTKLVKTFFENE